MAKYKITGLPKAQKGIIISDPAEYKYRKGMYDDSLDLHKQSLNQINQINYLDKILKPISETKYKEIEEWEKKQPSYSFDEVSYKKDLKNKRVKNFEDYVYNINDPKSASKFYENIGKYFEGDVGDFAITLADGRIKIPDHIYEGKPDFKDYQIYDPRTGTTKFYYDNKVYYIKNDKWKPEKTLYYGADKPDYSDVISVESINKSYKNNKLKSSTSKTEEFVSPSWYSMQYDIYRKPVQPVFFEGSEEPEFTSTIPEIGRLPIKTISQPETPELIQRNLMPEPIKYEPIKTASRSQTIMEPDPDRPGKYRMKDLRQVPYSAHFPGEGWEEMDAPRVLWIDDKGNEVEIDPRKNKKNGGLTKAQKGIIISDPDEYKYRKQMYDDSLAVYQQSLKSQKWLKKQPILNREHQLYSGTSWGKHLANIPSSYDAAYRRLTKANKKEPKGKHIDFNVTGVINGKDDLTPMYSSHTFIPKYKKPVQPVFFDKNYEEYIKKYPPIYVSDPNDPRIGTYTEAGNQFLYKKPTEPIIGESELEVGKLPTRKLPQIETPEFIQRNLIPKPINYDPIRTAKRLQTVMEPDPNKPGEYKIKDFKQVPYSAYFPGEGWQPMDAPGVAWINEKGEEVYEDPTRNKKNGGLTKAQEGIITQPELTYDAPETFAYATPAAEKKHKQLMDKARALMTTVRGKEAWYQDVKPKDFTNKELSRFIQGAEDYRKQAEEFERARRKVKEGKISTSDFARMYEERNWSRFDPYVMREGYKGQWQNAVDEAYARKAKNLKYTEAVLELTGAPALLRVVENPIETAKGVGQTVGDLATLPFGLGEGIYNYATKGDFDMGVNPLTGSNYGEGLNETLDAVSVIPFAKATGLIDDLARASRYVTNKLPLRNVPRVQTTTNPINTFELEQVAKQLPEGRKVYTLPPETVFDDIQLSNYASSAAKDKTFAPYIPGYGLTNKSIFDYNELGDFSFAPFSPGYNAMQTMGTLATYGKQPLLKRRDFATNEEMMIDKLRNKHQGDFDSLMKEAQAEGITPDAILLRTVRLMEPSERFILDQSKPFYLPENWSSSNRAAIWNSNYGNYRPFAKELNEFGSMGGKPPVSFGASGEFDQYYWDQIKTNEDFLTGDYNLSLEQREKIQSKLNSLYQKGIRQGIENLGLEKYKANLSGISPNQYGGQLPNAQKEYKDGGISMYLSPEEIDRYKADGYTVVYE